MPHDPALVPELYVSDIAVSRAFYTGVLGFSVLYERPAQGFCYLDHHGAHLMLEQMDDGPNTWLTGPMQMPFGRGMNLQITTPELAAIMTRVPPDHIFRPQSDAWYETDQGFAGLRQVLITDHDGYLLRFAQSLGTRPTPPANARTQRATE